MLLYKMTPLKSFVNKILDPPPRINFDSFLYFLWFKKSINSFLLSTFKKKLAS